MKTFMCIGFLVFVTGLGRAQEQSIESDSLDDYHVFMFDLIDQMNNGNYDPFFDAVDFDAIIDKAILDIPLPEVDKRALAMGMKQGASTQLRVNYSYMFDSTDLIEYVNYIEVGEYHSVLVRFTGSNGLNYIEFQLEKNQNDDIFIIDYYPYITGEFISATFNRTVKIIYNNQKESFLSDLLSGLSSKEKEFTESLTQLVEIQNLVMNGSYKEARETFESLPVSVQNNKIFIISVMQAAQNLNDDQFYLKLTDAYQKYYPDDPSLPLIVLDSYLIRGKIEEALEMVDILDEAVGGDNFLNHLRASILLIGERSQEAKEYLNLAIENDVYREESYWSLVELSLSEKDFVEVINYLDKISFIFGYEFTGENFSVEPYLEFKESEVFKEWIKTQ